MQESGPIEIIPLICTLTIWARILLVSILNPLRVHSWGWLEGGAWWAAVHGVTKSQTRLSDFTFTFHFHALEKEMATHSSVVTWRIPGTEEPGDAVYGVAQSRTRLKRLSSSSTSLTAKKILFRLLSWIIVLEKRINDTKDSWNISGDTVALAFTFFILGRIKMAGELRPFNGSHMWSGIVWANKASQSLYSIFRKRK